MIIKTPETYYPIAVVEFDTIEGKTVKCTIKGREPLGEVPEPPPPAEDFPEIIATTTDIQSSTTTSHTITTPAGYQDGDIIVALLRSVTGITFSGLDGFTRISHNDTRTAVFYRVVSGTMESTYTLTSNQSNRSAITTYLIRNSDDIEVVGILDTLNPPAITPTWGNFKNLYIAWASSTQGNQTINSIPANYTGLIDTRTLPGSTADVQRALFTSHRYLESASENPSTYNISNTNFEAAGTIAIKGK